MTSKLVLDLERILYVNHTRHLDRMFIAQLKCTDTLSEFNSILRFRDIFTSLDFNIKSSIRSRRYKVL
jgi:hypothetical protein